MEQPFSRIIQGNTLEKLKEISSESVDCIVTSPPYWGLRDYGEETNTIWGGDPDCQHEWGEEYEKPKRNTPRERPELPNPPAVWSSRDVLAKPGSGRFCKKCGAWYGQLGLEPTLDLYLDHLLGIMRELKRVLKKTGVMFWNHGDCYGGSGGAGGDYNKGGLKEGQPRYPGSRSKAPAKCMALQNYRFVLCCVDELGLILRNIIIWHKPNHMPASVDDRFTNAYEPVFMLVKNQDYWFDLDAVRVPHRVETWGLGKDGKYYGKARKDYRSAMAQDPSDIKRRMAENINPLGKNPSDVWTIPTEPFPEAHFATFPEKLVEPMIRAGCPQWICEKCGKARERIVEVEKQIYREVKTKGKDAYEQHDGEQFYYKKRWNAIHHTVGWTDCGCNAGWRPGIVLDPFMGSGTTGVVARKLARSFVGIELNPSYCEMARRRIERVPLPLVWAEEMPCNG